jgi:putative restriction endonuclease
VSAINHEQRAAKAWPVLSTVARRRARITYGELGLAVGIHHRAVAHVLGLIQSYCIDREIPPLNILAVNKDTGRPGDGFIAWDTADLPAGFAEVYAKNWSAEPNPFAYASDGTTQEELVRRIVEAPAAAADVYRLVKDRGIAQRIFRDALYAVYEGACAFCGLTFEDALEGAHVIAWAEANPLQRLSPSNGLLLCATHHRMFDAGLMVVGPDGTIVYCDPSGDEGPYSSADMPASVRLHGRPVRQPRDARHRISREAWSWRYRKNRWDKAPWHFR